MFAPKTKTLFLQCRKILLGLRKTGNGMKRVDEEKISSLKKMAWILYLEISISSVGSMVYNEGFLNFEKQIKNFYLH